VGRVRKTLRLLVLFCCVVVLAVGANAYADGPGGSTEHREGCIDDATGEEVPKNPDGSCPEGSSAATINDNDVTCGSDDDVAGLDVSSSSSGVEVCNDDADVPIQGRVMAAGDAANQSGYAGADGDKDNVVPLDGWIGVSSESGTVVACGEREGISVLLTMEGGNVERSLEHANEEDDIGDCVGI
jgi:hypothetical protein